jgi:hypothetical protein
MSQDSREKVKQGNEYLQNAENYLEGARTVFKQAGDGATVKADREVEDGNCRGATKSREEAFTGEGMIS